MFFKPRLQLQLVPLHGNLASASLPRALMVGGGRCLPQAVRLPWGLGGLLVVQGKEMGAVASRCVQPCKAPASPGGPWRRSLGCGVRAALGARLVSSFSFA